MTGQEDRLAEGGARGASRRAMRRPSTHPAASQDPESDERENMSDEEFLDPEDQYLAAFMDSLDQSVLPNIPPMPGYHVCWLTTSNPRDTVPNRIRMGYELITDKMIPGFEGASPKSAAYPGVIMVNEMLAARIPIKRYNRMMELVHHRMPLSEEEKLRAQIDGMKEDAASRGARVLEGDGMAGIVKRANPMPEFKE